MTEEAQTYDIWGNIDYTDILEDIRSEARYQSEMLEGIQEIATSQNEYLQTYLPELFRVSWLLLGSLIAYTLFRLLVSFLGRVFNDTTKL